MGLAGRVTEEFRKVPELQKIVYAVFWIVVGFIIHWGGCQPPKPVVTAAKLSEPKIIRVTTQHTDTIEMQTVVTRFVRIDAPAKALGDSVYGIDTTVRQAVRELPGDTTMVHVNAAFDEKKKNFALLIDAFVPSKVKLIQSHTWDLVSEKIPIPTYVDRSDGWTWFGVGGAFGVLLSIITFLLLK